jgi:hypothetical protein
MRATWLVAGSSIGSMPSGTAAGSARHRREPDVASDRDELAEEVLDVRLVTRALAAQDVGVHDDERAHAATSR